MYARHLKMFGVRQPLPVLLAARLRLDEPDFAKFIRAVVMMSFRYNVIGNLQTSEQERTYHAEAKRIARGEHASLREILEGLRTVYPSDERFRSSFAEKSIEVKQARNRRIVRYILCELEHHRSGKRPDSESGEVSLEHICPLHPDGDWEHFTDDEIDSLGSRLGNMLLLEAKLNRDIGNAAYERKRSAYRDSAYETTRRVAEEYAEWTPSRIDARQQAMAKVATAIWRVEQLS